MLAKITLTAAICLSGTKICCAAPFITAPPVPQPRQQGDLAGLVLQNASADRTGTKLITFGQIFDRGQLPKGGGLAARISQSSEPVQADVKSTYADGSVRFAVLTMAAPPLRSGEKLPVMLETASSPARGSLDIGRALAAHDIRITLNLSAVGDPAKTGQTDQTLTFDAATLLAHAMADHTVSPWLSGPLATETRVTQRVAGSLRLVLDLRAYRGGAIGADIQFNNDIAMQKRGGGARYGVTITEGGRTVFAMPKITEYQYQDWHTIIRSDGRAPINVVHDVAAMERANAVPSYELKYGVAPKALAEEVRQIRQPGWDKPLAVDGITQYMPMTGGRPDIGPTTVANSIWLITQNPIAAVYAIGQADAGGAIPWHMFNLKTGNFITLFDYPNIWMDGRGGPNSGTTGLTQQVYDKTGWSADNAHEPDLAFIPYLMTGRRYYLDQLNAEASWDETSFWPADQARHEGEGIVVDASNQVRGAAWSLREIGDAAYINPDGSAMKAFFTRMVANNMNFVLKKIPAWTKTEGEAYGYIPGAYGNNGNMAPWEQDFFATTIGLIAQRGDQDAARIVKWESHYITGRFFQAKNGFPPHDAITYNVGVYDPKTKKYHKTWAGIERGTAATGQANGDGWQHSQGYYGQTALAALASEINVTHSPKSWRAYDWLLHSDAPYISIADFAGSPQFWIVPLSSPPANLAR